jgi:Ca2+-binding RTX toxin-like protein
MSRLVAATNGSESYAVSASGKTLYVAGDDGVLRVYSVSSGALLNHWKVGTDLDGVAISPDGTQVLATEHVPVSTQQSDFWTNNVTEAAIYQLDLASGYKQTYIYEAKGSDYTFVDVIFADSNRALITENILPGWSGWAPIISLDLEAGTFKTNGSYYSGLGATPSLTRIPGTTNVLVGQLGLSSADYYILGAAGKQLRATETYGHGVQGYAPGIEAVSGSGANGRIAVVTGGKLHLFDGNLKYLDDLTTKYPALGSASALAFDAGGKVLYAVDAASHKIIGISMTTFVETQRISFGEYAPAVLPGGEELRLLPDGTRFLMATTAGIIAIDRPTTNVPTSGNDVLRGTSGDDTFGGGDGDDRIFGMAGADKLYGDKGNDRLSGGGGADQLSGGAGDDKLVGDAGRDLVMGGTGKDALYGGAGPDTFRFVPGDTGATRETADIIYDFSRAQGDKIDLSAFDTNATRGGIQPFLFVGSADLTPGGGKLGGELHYVQAGGYTYVEGDANRDGVVDMVISLKGTIDLVAADFLI